MVARASKAPASMPDGVTVNGAIDNDGNPYTSPTGRPAGIADAVGEIVRRGDRVVARGRGYGRVRCLLSPGYRDPIGVDLDDGSRCYCNPSDVVLVDPSEGA